MNVKNNFASLWQFHTSQREEELLLPVPAADTNLAVPLIGSCTQLSSEDLGTGWETRASCACPRCTPCPSPSFYSSRCAAWFRTRTCFKACEDVNSDQAIPGQFMHSHSQNVLQEFGIPSALLDLPVAIRAEFKFPKKPGTASLTQIFSIDDKKNL